MRCMGAALVVTPNSVVMRRGEIPEAEYQADRAQWLAPHEARLIALLAELGKWNRSSMVPKRVHGGVREQAQAQQ